MECLEDNESARTQAAFRGEPAARRDLIVCEPMGTLVAFDLDGTLIDSQRDLAESANRMLATYGAGPLAIDDVASMVGDGARQLVVRALEAAGVQADDVSALGRFVEIYSEHLVVHTRPYDGIPELLARLEGRAALAVLTNKPEGMSRRLLAVFGMTRFFPWVIGGDSPRFPRKPDAAGLRHLIESTGATPLTTVLVGDSMVDVTTARTAGAHVCAAGYGFGKLRQPLVLQPGELLANRPGDLEGLLEPFWLRDKARTNPT